MLLKNIARSVIFPAVLVVASVIHAGCSSDAGVHYAAPDTNSRPATQSTPQPTPNPDQAAGLLTRFYRDISTGTQAAYQDMFSITSHDFVRNHHDDLVNDYAFIQDPKIQVREVVARTVTYTMDYVYVAENKSRLYWERSGRWTLNHGAASGWVLDNDAWDSIHLVGISTPDRPQMTPVKDTVYSDGRHEFNFNGEAVAFVADHKGWHLAAVATPTPPPPSGFVPDPPAVADQTSTDTDTSTTDTETVASTGQTHFYRSGSTAALESFTCQVRVGTE